MKKLLLTIGCFAGFSLAQAATLPEPDVRIVGEGWFDSFNVVWWEEVGVKPYELSSTHGSVRDGVFRFDADAVSQVKVMKNMTEELEINEISIQEFSYEDSAGKYTNYEEGQLLVTLDPIALQFPSEATYYTIYIPAGMLEITLEDGSKVSNEAINQGFTVSPYEAFEVPEPVLDPSNQVLSSIEKVSITWPNSKTGVNSLLKLFQPENVTVTQNGNLLSGVKVEGGWSDENIKTGDQDGDMLVVDLGQEYTVPGTYEIHIPSAMMWISDLDGGGTMDNPAYTFTYTVIPDPKAMNAPVLNPASDSNPESLKVITLTWDDGLTLVQGNGNITFIANGENVENIQTSISANVLTITLPEEYFTPGEYVLTVPEGFVTANDNSGYTYFNNYVEASYTIKPSMAHPGVMGNPVSVDPEENSILNSVATVTLTWNLPLQLNNASNDVITLTQMGGNNSYDGSASVNGNNLIVSFTGVEDGAYTLTVPAEFVIGINEADNTAYYNQFIQLHYGVEGQDEITGQLDEPTYVEPVDGSTVAELVEVIVSWNFPLELNAENEENVVLENNENGDSYVADVVVEGNNLVITLDNVEDGTYTLTIPAEFVIATTNTENAYNQEVILNYIVDEESGVSLILDNQQDNNIYTINGIKVNGQSLSNGLYIINGKKVIIKK